MMASAGAEEEKIVRLFDVQCDDTDAKLVESIENEANYVGRRLVTNVEVPGNIHKESFRTFWEETLQPTEMVRDTVRRGYALPFREIPPPSHEPNNKSARHDMSFVRAEVRRLEKLGCIYKVTEKPYLLLPLSSIFSKKKRLVVDASRGESKRIFCELLMLRMLQFSALNPFLLDRQVRLQDHRDIPNVLSPNMWQCCDDLDSGYWHLGILEDHQKFLGIQIDDEAGKPVFFQWRVMFLGIKDAVFIFTAILKPVRALLAAKAIPNLIYLDDLWFGGETKSICLKNREVAREVLKNAGYVVSIEKAKEPSQRILFLGLEVCSSTMMFFIPESKLLHIINTINFLCAQRKVQLRRFASLLGFLQSCARALGNVVRLMTRASYHWMTEKLSLHTSYNMFYVISEEVRTELFFWKANVRSLNGFPINPSQSLTETRISIVTDASADGAFGFEISDRYRVILRKGFSSEEKKASSTERELLALKYIYATDISWAWKGLRILHLTDNRGVEAITHIGSSKPHLQNLALEVFKGCKDKGIHLEVQWRPRDNYLLAHADRGSKSFDASSFSLDGESFCAMMEYFPEVPIDVDGMAEWWNRKSSFYFSRDEDIHAAGTNFFAQEINLNWSVYIFPPAGLIVSVILHLAHFKSNGLIIIPAWPSASFWLRIAPDGRHLAGWAERFLRFRPGMVSDINIQSGTFKSPLTFDILAVKFNFNAGRDLYGPRLSHETCLNYGCDDCN